ncbi:hypothetical protein DEALK_00450 [Dehalogenimonas alkenigignens]|uniref:Uncharacterized protein n=1 Tax=Dehalogenimonas alkenigignens TaxID=1217799 RepID=A0A0W0GKP7_9CHLR|nr:hypothetical protein [Dehalogenimonas alkenigignens]KTB49133.1 hypothetical protein DEALK_00450 [Dehalogenimonas alkenigignens]
MPIKWSALKVSEAMDMVQEFIDQAAEPLEQAKIVAAAAGKIPGIPQYVEGRLLSLITNIDRLDTIRSSIEAVRGSLPSGAAAEEQVRIESGSQLVLVA